MKYKYQTYGVALVSSGLLLCSPGCVETTGKIHRVETPEVVATPVGTQNAQSRWAKVSRETDSVLSVDVSELRGAARDGLSVTLYVDGDYVGSRQLKFENFPRMVEYPIVSGEHTFEVRVVYRTKTRVNSPQIGADQYSFRVQRLEATMTQNILPNSSHNIGLRIGSQRVTNTSFSAYNKTVLTIYEKK